MMFSYLKTKRVQHFAKIALGQKYLFTCVALLATSADDGGRSGLFIIKMQNNKVSSTYMQSQLSMKWPLIHYHMGVTYFTHMRNDAHCRNKVQVFQHLLC